MLAATQHLEQGYPPPLTTTPLTLFRQSHSSTEGADLNQGMLFDKSQKDENHDDTKPPHLGLAASFQQQPSTSSKKSGHYSSDMDLEQFASIMNNTEFDFDFNETTEHNEKSFDPLKFLLKEINGGATTELSFNQAELEPVQVSCQQAFCFLSVYLSLHPQTRRLLNNISLN